MRIKTALGTVYKKNFTTSLCPSNPQQKNNIDCGVALCYNARRIAEVGANFEELNSQNNWYYSLTKESRHLRKRLAVDVVNGAFPK